MGGELRNFELFDAPHVAIVCMEKRFGVRVAVDVGGYVQTLLLALWSRGIASCEASLSTYPADPPRVVDPRRFADLVRRFVWIRRPDRGGESDATIAGFVSRQT